MRLPKYIPGQVVIVGLSEPEMVVIAHAAPDWTGKGWTYFHSHGFFGEEAVSHVLNGSMWVPAERWNGPTQARDRSQDVLDILEEERKVRIEVKDGNS